MEQTLAAVLADFAASTTPEKIPGAVRKAALWHVLDTIGVCIAGANPREESGQAARQLAEKWKARPGAMIFGLNASCRPEMAALLNGSLAQALEMDDKHGSSLARPGSTVTPAVLAVAQANNTSLRDVVTAVTVGYEVMIRLGFVAGDRFLERGYHTSSLLGAFGTVAAVGSLLRASPETIVNAMGIAGTFSAGIQEATRTGSTSKILHGGWGAHSGVIALELASAGITGPASVFEGKFGFFNCFLTPITGELDFAKAAEGLGSRWYLPETAYKPYPCCQLIHAFIEGCKQIRAELKEIGKPLDTIEQISCQLAEPGLTLVTEPKDRKMRPTSSPRGAVQPGVWRRHDIALRRCRRRIVPSGAAEGRRGAAARRTRRVVGRSRLRLSPALPGHHRGDLARQGASPAYPLPSGIARSRDVGKRRARQVCAQQRLVLRQERARDRRGPGEEPGYFARYAIAADRCRRVAVGRGGLGATRDCGA